MKRKSVGIFGKVFLYTIIIQVIVIMAMFSFYAEQIRAAVTFTQQRQTTELFRPFLKALNGKGNGDIARLCRDFHEKNDSVQFRFESLKGDLIFETEDFELQNIDALSPRSSGWFPGGNPEYEPGHQFSLLLTKKHELFFMTETRLSMGDVKLYVAGDQMENDIYGQFRNAITLVLGFLIFFSLLAAFFFARKIAKPIRAIAGDTHRMALLEDVPAPKQGGDEIGHLATDVYQMYTRLKDTIHALEGEVGRRKEMEENQRYFFAAASHELKTPIAATGAILEGISSGVVTDEERPGYLRECMKLMDDQSRLVTEILEVMKLNETGYRLEHISLDLKAAIDMALEAHRETAESKALQVDIQMDQEMPRAMADPNLLGKALSNVIGNAVQNTEKGGRVLIFTKRAVRDAGQEKKISLHILNFGASIPKDLLPKLFEPFYHADPARTRSVSRTGLGLTIVRKSLEMMQVPHRLENTADGVLFTMELPCGK